MTLVLSLQSRDSLWVVTDRRLSYGGRRPPIDNAVKILNLETTDGVGVLAYAGLGATAKGTQPSEWMSAVLRGRGRITFEHALGHLATAANKELPPHLALIPGGAHVIIAHAFIQGVGRRFYSIDNVVDRTSGRHSYRFTNHTHAKAPGVVNPPLAVTGTGGLYIAQKGNELWRSLVRLGKAHDHDQVSDLLIADELARLNYEAHQRVANGSVGPRCIVVWRRRRDTQREISGGGQRCYTGVDRDDDSPVIPTIANGIDLKSVAGLLMKQVGPLMSTALDSGEAPELDKDELNRLMAQLPRGPDEKLR